MKPSKRMTLTPWFDGREALPTRAGYYLTRPHGGGEMWDYHFWWFDPAAPTDLGIKLFWFHHNGPKAGVRLNCTSVSDREWCGLTRPVED